MDMKKCNLFEVLTQDRLEWRNKIHVTDPNIVETALVMIISIVNECIVLCIHGLEKALALPMSSMSL